MKLSKMTTFLHVLLILIIRSIVDTCSKLKQTIVSWSEHKKKRQSEAKFRKKLTALLPFWSFAKRSGVCCCAVIPLSRLCNCQIFAKL